MNNTGKRLSPLERIDNRRALMIENALAQNNFFDCDVIQYNADRLRDAEVKAVIEGIGEDLIGAVKYRGGQTLRLRSLLQEIKDIGNDDDDVCEKCGEIHDVEKAGGHDLIQADTVLRCECSEHPDDEFCRQVLKNAYGEYEAEDKEKKREEAMGYDKPLRDLLTSENPAIVRLAKGIKKEFTK